MFDFEVTVAMATIIFDIVITLFRYLLLFVVTVLLLFLFVTLDANELNIDPTEFGDNVPFTFISVAILFFAVLQY